MRVRRVGLRKLLDAVPEELEDHEEHNEGPEGGVPHHGHVGPRPLGQRSGAAELVGDAQIKPPARVCVVIHYPVKQLID